MSKEYVTFEQACELLAKSATELKAMIADGRLHELRDAGKVFFKRSELAEIAAKEGSSIVNLSASDEAGPDAGEGETFSSALASLAEPSSGLGVLDESPSSGTPVELDTGVAEAIPAEGDAGEIPMALDISPSPGSAELQATDVPEHLPAAPKDSAGQELTSEIDLLPGEDSMTGAPPKAPPAKKPAAQTEPAALGDEVPDLGLSGSSIISLEAELDDVSAPPRPAPAAKAPPPKAPDKPAKTGISVFDDDELVIATDPMGETRIGSGVEPFEAVGSGSGLLDLTQEKDDTSLGAELLDVISPTDAVETATEAAATAQETVEGEPDAMPVEAEPAFEQPVEAAVAVAAPPRVAVAVGSMAGAGLLNVCAILGLLGLATVGLATAAQLQGVWPSFLSLVSKSILHYSVFGGLLLVSIVFGVLGILAGRGK